MPNLKLVAVGEIVDHGAYSYLGESLTSALRAKWIAAIEKAESFHSEHVVVRHKVIGTLEGGLDTGCNHRLLGAVEGLARDAFIRNMFGRVFRDSMGSCATVFLPAAWDPQAL